MSLFTGRRVTPNLVTDSPELRLPAVVKGAQTQGFSTEPAAQAKIATARALSDELIESTKSAMPKSKSSELSGEQMPTGDKSGGTSIGEHALINGHKVMLKPNYTGDRDMNVNDVFANTLRKQAGFPSLAVAEGVFPINHDADPLVIHDYARARINGLDESFTSRVREWTPEQKLAVTQDMVWSLFLEDFDKGTRQYKVIELDPATHTKGVASGDWDHATVELPRTGQTGVDAALTRYNNFNNFPTAQNLAFIDFVRGKTDLDLDVMRATAQQLVTTLTREDIGKAIEPYVQKHYGTLDAAALEGKRSEITDQVRARLDKLEPVTEAFIKLVEAERTQRAEGSLPLGARMRYGMKDMMMRAQGRFGASELMNQTFNKGMRTFRDATAEIPTYRASDPTTQVGTIKSSALKKVMARQADAFESAKKAQKPE